MSGYVRANVAGISPDLIVVGSTPNLARGVETSTSEDRTMSDLPEAECSHIPANFIAEDKKHSWQNTKLAQSKSIPEGVLTRRKAEHSVK